MVKQPKIVIVMPAWNEAESIGQMIESLVKKVFPQISATMHLLVVDNYSSDGMTEIVQKKSKRYKNVEIIQQGKKKGLGNAYVVGMKHAIDNLKADAILEMDADGQHPAQFVKPMVEAYLSGADYVIGSRYVRGGSVPKQWEISRKAISYFGNLFIRLVLLKPKIHDLTTGFRLTKVDGVLNRIKLDKLMELEHFAYKVDLLYQSIKLSKRVVEVPLEFKPRLRDKSKFNTNEMISTFKVAVILGIKDKQRLVKFAVVGIVGFMVNFILLRVFRSIGVPETFSWALSTEAAIVSNFTFNNVWTFKSESIGGLTKLVSKFLQFNLTSAGALIIQSIFGPLGVRVVGEQWDFLVLAFVVGFLVLPYNYFMYNAVIWGTWKIPFIRNTSSK